MHSMLANNAPGKRMDRLCVTGRLEFSDAKMQNISPVGYSGLCITHEHSAQKKKFPACSSYRVCASVKPWHSRTSIHIHA